MSANPEHKVPASITIHQEGKKELEARKEAETYRVFSVDYTRLRRARRTRIRTNCVYIYFFSNYFI
jgi:hypothetical protein